MDSIGGGLLLTLTTALLTTLVWVSWSLRQHAGLWWAGAGVTIALDGVVTATGTPSALAPYSGDALNPVVAWLFYVGTCRYRATRPHPAALLLCVGATASWFALHHLGFSTLPSLAAVIGEAPPVLAGLQNLRRAATTTLGHLLAAACWAPVVLIALSPWLRGASGEVEIWLAVVGPLALLMSCALLERSSALRSDALLQANEQLRLADQIAELGAWTIDAGTGRVEWSDQMYEIFGVPRGTPLRDATEQLEFVDPRDRDRVRRNTLDALRGGPVDAEFRTCKGNGESGSARVRARMLSTKDGRRLLIGTTIDTTEHRRTLEALEEHRNNLEELVAERTRALGESQTRVRNSERLASIGTLAGGIAHQVNNPVAAIVAASDLALSCEGEADEVEMLRDALREVQREALRCGEIVREVLAFASDRPTDKKVIPLDPILERAREALGHAANARKAEILIEAEGPSPLVSASAIELEQAVANLLQNALQSRPEGARVVLRRSSDDESVRIEVEDDGRGIPPADLGRVMDPFFTSRLDEGGTGLGLSVAHGIAREHGGTLSLVSEVAHGTRATLELPQAG